MRKQFLTKAAAVLLCGALTAGALSACKQKQVILENADSDAAQSVSDTGGILNFTPPEPGEEIVVLTIRDYGDVKIRLFPEESEKGVENFKKLVESGFYDELIFHRVIDGFVIQGGDPKGNGTGGVDAWGDATGFAQTISDHLCHFSGAVAYATADDHMNNSQFYIVTGETITPEYLADLRTQFGKSYSPAAESLYQLSGGYPALDGEYEVFGQVFEGLEYCLEIQKVPTDSNDKPKSAVMIEKAVVTEYDGEAPHWLSAAGEEIEIGLSD